MNFFRNVIARAMHGQLSKLDELYQSHSGQECYLFGNGVSLKWMELSQFSDRLSILGNNMFVHREVKSLKFPYYTIVEPFWFWPYFPEHSTGKLRIVRNLVNKEYRKFIFQNPETRFLINFSNYPVARFPNALYISRFYKSPFNKNNPFVERKDTHAGTLKFQISLAIYLGFKKAYLVGQDYTHYPSKSMHFFEKGEGILNTHTHFCQEFIEYAKQYIDLVTVTLGTGSKTMDFITYKDLTGKEPHYRENIDIVDRAQLECLATSDLKWYPNIF